MEDYKEDTWYQQGRLLYTVKQSPSGSYMTNHLTVRVEVANNGPEAEANDLATELHQYLTQHRATPAAARCGRGCGVGREARVSVKDRLPEMLPKEAFGLTDKSEDWEYAEVGSQEVLVYTAGGLTMLATYHAYDKAWVAQDDNLILSQVTHWQVVAPPASPTTAAAAGAPEAGEEV